ncbi:FAD-dependent oxidoreductase [Sphingomonas sediminicola]|uniref:Thioredoxin reductase n=1 Tax=Sphingomonas sediminicola TaxID=386874 RepID=A0ABX6T5L8_9SPHN|nr:FAD-dependent oxidoreductase [Sphingomonas sediminicola]QNP45122.1 FAD-dependent oxidoreductase [Sphingomonas sediminicola]
MSDAQRTLFAERGAQMFPRLTDDELARLSKFGEPRSFRAGERVGRVGETGPGLMLILSGEVEVTEPAKDGKAPHIVTHSRGNFTGELAQLSGRPVLVDSTALTGVEGVAIAPDRLRALLIAEAELGERIMRALILRRVGLIESGAGPIIIGDEADADVLRLVNFLRRNGHPYQRLDPTGDSCAETLVQRFQVSSEELPIVLCPGGQLLRNPTEHQLARCVGLVGPINAEKLYDVAVIGAGPSGLATSVYAASEGLSVLTIDCRSFGGQAGASARIENYLGFPTGISGMALMGRAFSQAQKFGVEIAIPDEAVKLECGNDPCHLLLATGERIQARSVVIATGARYRRLAVDRLDEFEGSSVHYWASPLEADLAANEEVTLVGGGNSAGQATVFLASRAKHVTLVARRPLSDTMSQYLIERIESLPNVDVVIGSEVARLAGADGALEGVELRNRSSGTEEARPCRFLFSFIGAEPNTDWLQSSGLKLDGRGFVLTGGDERLPLETNKRGIFAVGDVRSGSVKRVAASVGDGAQVVAAIHQYLAAQEKERPVSIQPQMQVTAAE